MLQIMLQRMLSHFKKQFKSCMNQLKSCMKQFNYFKVESNDKSENSERRKCITVTSGYYRIDQASLTSFVGNSDLFKIEVECQDVSIITMFNFDDQPLFYERNKVIIPTAYCLGTLFDMLPAFTIHEKTVSYITDGSVLMIPGIIVEKPLNEQSYEAFNKR